MDALHPLPVTEPRLGLGERIAAHELTMTDARSSVQVAAVAARSWEKLARHFARILGEVGIRILLRRSLRLTRATIPWLEVIAVSDARPPWKALQQQRDADEAARAFAELLATCIQLIARLIGESLVAQLLQEIWPDVTVRGDQETT